MRLAVIIAAAGRSERFGGQDKLSQDLGGRPVLVRAVEPFAKRDETAAVIVAGPAEADGAFDAFRERYGPTLGFHGAQLVAGSPASRAGSVAAALARIPDDATHVAVHDAARPAAGEALLGRVLLAARRLDAVVPACPINGTVKRTTGEAEVVREEDEDAVADALLGDAGKSTVEARTVVETIRRGGLVEVQTPQVFAAELLRKAYTQDGIDDATDDAMLVERLGEPVHVVEGDPRNIKITTPEDLELIRAILGMGAPPERPAHLRF